LHCTPPAAAWSLLSLIIAYQLTHYCIAPHPLLLGLALQPTSAGHGHSSNMVRYLLTHLSKLPYPTHSCTGYKVCSQLGACMAAIQPPHAQLPPQHSGAQPTSTWMQESSHRTSRLPPLSLYLVLNPPQHGVVLQPAHISAQPLQQVPLGLATLSPLGLVSHSDLHHTQHVLHERGTHKCAKASELPSHAARTARKGNEQVCKSK